MQFATGIPLHRLLQMWGAPDAGSITAASPPSRFGDVDAAIHGAEFFGLSRAFFRAKVRAAGT
jgi:hypothetical protein